MKDLTIAVLGENAGRLCKSVAKKGTVKEIEYYDREEEGHIFTFVTPRDYPEKIQPLLACLALADHVVIVQDTLNAALGEIILACDAARISTSDIMSLMAEEKLRPLLENTTLRSSNLLLPDDEEVLLERLRQLDPPVAADESCICVIDQFFPSEGNW